MEARPLELSELLDRQRWLVDLRWTAAAGLFAIVFVLKWLVGVDLQFLPLFAIAAIIALYNLGFWMYVGGRETPSPQPPTPNPREARRAVVAANLQISLDLIALTFVLHFVGGVENPFFLYYIFHVIIASILLSPEASYLQATLAVALFAGLAGLEYAGLVPHVSVSEMGTAGLYSQSLYVAAVLAALVSTVYFAAYLATSIVGSLRARETQVIELKEALEKEEHRLQEAYHRLQEVERYKSQYLRKVSHELRAPLSSVQSLITVVREGYSGPVPDKVKEILGRASIRTGELLNLVGDLLSLSRAREIKPEQTREEVSLAGIAARLVPLFQAQAVEKGQSLAVNVEPDLPNLWADREGMEELFSNLVSNAIKYTPPGGRVRVTLEMGPSKGRDELVLTVSDTGIGIEAEEIPHVFEEFHRAKRAREMAPEGTGLGLAIVKAIVDAHGGRVEMRSEVGEGTTVVVTLPGVRGWGLGDGHHPPTPNPDPQTRTWE